jgi:membrane protein DedA with SNARE-associated domain
LHFDVRAIADALGYPAAGLGLLVESAGIPFPGETMTLAAAAYAGAGRLDVRVVVLVAAAASLAGANLGYGAGYRGGRPFVERFSHALHLNPGHMARTEAFFARYGAATVLFGRFVLGLRTWSALMAGMARMPFWRFQLASAAGALIWATVIGAIGFYLGRNWGLVTRLVGYLGVGGVIVVVALILALWVIRRRALRIGR